MHLERHSLLCMSVGAADRGLEGVRPQVIISHKPLPLLGEYCRH